MACRISLEDANFDSNNDGTSLRAPRSSTRKQCLVASNKIDLMVTPAKATRTNGTRMITRGRKVSLSPVVKTPLPEAKKTRSHTKAALAPSASIPSANSFPGSKKRAATTTFQTEMVGAPQKKKAKRNVTGRWEQWEQLEFLKGLRMHGRGHWKVIAEQIPTRTTVQVKTHAQVELKKLDSGINIFEELDEFLREEEGESENNEIVPAKYDETLEVELDDIDEDVVVETPNKVIKKKTPPKKSSKKKNPKKKSPKVAVDPLFLLSPRTAAMHNTKTPVMSNKSFGTVASTGCPSSISFTTSSSVTMTTSTFRHYLPHQRIAGPMRFHPMATSGTLPPSFFHVPLPLLPKTSTALTVPGVNLPEAYMATTTPTGNYFGVYEAATTLLGLSTAGDAASSTGVVSGFYRG